MSDYKVIALKYRPQKFEEVVGQEHITQTLKNAIGQGRIAHAYLLVGPRGTGKTSTARIFAKALNCQSSEKPTPVPCGKCNSCLEIAAGTSMSVLEIDGASNNGVDQVRDLRESVQYSPAGVRYKVYIIDEVHMLSPAAFNALLKTLEEPPAHVKFVFATTEPQKVLPTILSRCQRFDFHRIPQDLIVSHLELIAKAEKIEVSRNALAAVARGAEGGMRDAESALDQLIAFCGGKIGEEDVLSIFGLVSADQLRAMVEALFAGETKLAIEKLDEIAAQGKDLVRLLTELMEALRNILVVQAGVTPSDWMREEQEWFKKMAGRIEGPRLLRMVDILADADAQMRYALSKKIFFEIAMIKVVQALSEISLDEVIRKLSSLDGGQGSPGNPGRPTAEPRPEKKDEPPRAAEFAGKTPVSKAPEAEPARPAPVVPARAARDPESDKLWNDLLSRVEKVSKMLKNQLSKGRLISAAGDEFVIGFDAEFELEKVSIENPKTHTQVLTKVREMMRRDINLRIVVADDPKIPQPHAHIASSAPDESDASRKKFEDDPLIKKAMEVFKSQILEVRK